MATKSPRALSDMPIPPGEILEEELEARGMTQRELAARLGRPPQAINEIVRARKAITPDTALGLEKVLGIGAHFWTNLEANYRVILARERDKQSLQTEVLWLSEYPIVEMIRRGWIEAGRDRPGRLKALQSFLGAASAEPRLYQEAVGFRITETAQSRVSLGALAAWLRKGELDAQELPTADYNEKVFCTALDEIRGMTSRPPEDFVPAIATLCADAGVAFCVVRELPKSGANGAARWLTGRKALIQMSIRGKWADIFWFSFFHKACHLIRHKKQRRIVIDGLGPDPDSTGMEAEADQFARDFLIPPERWVRFCEEGRFTQPSVKAFAQSVGIAPFVVVGRLQKEKLIRYNRLTSLKRRYEWVAGPDG